MPTHTFYPSRSRGLILSAALLTLVTAAAGGSLLDLRPDPSLALGAGMGTPNLHYRYGTQVAMGKGFARTYTILDGMTGNPVEVGVALSEQALDSLPVLSPDHAPGTHGPHREYLLELPADNATPYRFVEVDWNPMGHGGPYTAPHLDFHFYRVPLATRNAIDLAAADFASKAARLPAEDEIPAGYVSTHVLLNTTPAGMTVPRMGLHWLDTRSPELPPTNRPFTSTFIVGSWDGQVIFDEPMITRDFILAQRGSTAGASFPVPAARRYVPAGFYMTSYGVTWDPGMREYRIALKGLTRRG
jgi:uncharacterized protein